MADVWLVIWTEPNNRQEKLEIIECESLDAAKTRAEEHYQNLIKNSSIEWGNVPANSADIIGALGYSPAIQPTYQIYKHYPNYWD